MATAAAAQMRFNGGLAYSFESGADAEESTYKGIVSILDQDQKWASPQNGATGIKSLYSPVELRNYDSRSY